MQSERKEINDEIDRLTAKAVVYKVERANYLNRDVFSAVFVRARCLLCIFSDSSV